MITVNIRKQGGAAVITIPADILKILNLDIGSTLGLDIQGQGFTVHPIADKKPQRYTLEQLLEGVSPQYMKSLIEKTKPAREGGPVGREIV